MLSPHSGLQVVMPWNDSYEQRIFSIEISYDSDYSGKHWTEWEEIYSCSQLGLSNGQTPVLEDLKNRTVAMKSKGKTFKMDVADNASGKALKLLLLEGDLSVEMYVADNCMSSMSGDATKLLRERIPLNHKEYKAISVGEVHMYDYGFFIIENENRKRGIRWPDHHADSPSLICRQEHLTVSFLKRPLFPFFKQ